MDTRLTASDVVYLYGGSFADRDSLYTEGVLLESSGRKVQKWQLLRAMVLAALASLLQDGWIELAVVDKGFIFKSHTPIVRRAVPEPYPQGGLESTLLSKLAPLKQDDDVGQVVERLLDGKQQDARDVVLDCARAHLVDTGHFRRVGNLAELRVEPNFEAISGSSGEVHRVRGMLAEVGMRHGRAWELVVKQVDEAFRSQEPGNRLAYRYGAE